MKECRGRFTEVCENMDNGSPKANFFPTLNLVLYVGASLFFITACFAAAPRAALLLFETVKSAVGARGIYEYKFIVVEIMPFFFVSVAVSAAQYALSVFFFSRTTKRNAERMTAASVFAAAFVYVSLAPPFRFNLVFFSFPLILLHCVSTYLALEE